MIPRFKSTIRSSGQLCSVSQNETSYIARNSVLLAVQHWAYPQWHQGGRLKYFSYLQDPLWMFLKVLIQSHPLKATDEVWEWCVVSSGVDWWTPHVTGRITTESWCLSGQTLGLRRDSSGQRWECRAFSDQVWLCITDLLWTSFSFLKRSRRSPKNKPKVRF